MQRDVSSAHCIQHDHIPAFPPTIKDQLLSSKALLLTQV